MIYRCIKLRKRLGMISRMLLSGFFLLLSLTGNLFAQDFSNKGKDFWIGYGNHVRMIAGNPAEQMQLYITSDVTTTGNVSIPSVGFNQNFNVAANQIIIINIPRSAALLNDGLYDHGIHVVAEKPIVVYSFIYVNNVSGATLCLPTSTLGRSYYSINYTQISNEPNAAYSYFFVIATDTGRTSVQITPTQNTAGGRLAGVPFTVDLNQGQVYQVLARSDLSGSDIVSVNNGSGCKKIAVYSGAGKMSIGCTDPLTGASVAGSSDNLYQQMYPTSTWGKTYVTVPSVNLVPPGIVSGQFNYYRIFKSNPNARVFRNGVEIPAGSFIFQKFFTIGPTNVPEIIESDYPIMVAQYFTTQGCSGNAGVGDPEMIYLNPVEQTVSNVTLYSMQPATGTNIREHYINVVVKNSPGAINTFRIDGVAYPFSFAQHPSAPNYAYARIPVSLGPHTLTCDTPFNAIAYGFGQAESYGYSAGTNLKDLYQFVSIKNEYAEVAFPSGCRSTPFRFSMTFPYQPLSIQWKFNGLFTDTTINAPLYDSTWVVNGRTLYRYALDKLYTINTTGTYPISIRVNNPTLDGCTGLQEIEYDLQIFDRPTSNFNFVHNGCVSDTVTFIDNSNGNGRAITRYSWSFGDDSISNKLNPKHKYQSAGNKTVRYSVITDIGCLSDTAVRTIPISDPPIAKFGIAAPICEKALITFTDSSVTPSGTIVKWNWNFGEGPVLSAGNNNPVTHVYNNAGIYNVSLEIESNTGCRSLLYTYPLVVRPKPQAYFPMPGNVCLPDGRALFTDSSFISDSSVLTYEWDFGDNATSTEGNPVHRYTALGPYNVNLRVTSPYGCIDDTTRVLSTVYPPPIAGFTVTPEVCLRDSTRFSDASSGAGSTVRVWRWIFGDGRTDTLQNPVYRYGAIGDFRPALQVLTDKGCPSDTFRLTTTVHPLPVADFTVAAPACERRNIQFTDASQAGVGTVSSWYWAYNNGSPVTADQSSITASFPDAGDHPVTLVVRNTKGCRSDTLIRPVRINYLPAVHFGMPEVCLSDPFAAFTDSSSIGDSTEAQFSYVWDFGDPNADVTNPNTSTDKDPQHRYTQIGVYDVRLTVTSGNGCIDTTIYPFTVNGSVPVAQFSVNMPDDLCSNEEVGLYDSSSVDFGKIVRVEIYWDDINDQTIVTRDEDPSNGKMYTHLYPDFGTPATKDYQVRYVAYSGINCVNEITQTITVKASPAIQFDPLNAVCEEVNPFPLTGAREVFGWPGRGEYSGKGVNSNTGIFDPGTAGPGTHAIGYTYDAENGCSAYSEQNILVHPTPEVNAGPDRTVLEGGSVELLGSGNGNALTFVWAPNIAIDSNRILRPQVSPTDDITYTLTALSADGCRASDPVLVKVLKTPRIPNAFSPNGDGINDKWVIEYLESYPGATVEIFNRYGQLIYRSEGYGKPWDGTYNGQPLPVATYYWIINPKNGRKQMNGSVTIIR